MWDSIGVVGLQSVLGRLHDTDPSVATDLEYLLARGVVDALPSSLAELQQYARTLGARYKIPAGVMSTRLRAPLQLRRDQKHRIPLPSSAPVLGPGFEQVVAQIERSAGWYSVPVVTAQCIMNAGAHVKFFDHVGLATRERRVSEVVLRALPVPRGDTPLEAILDFRADPRTREFFERLRLWMISAAEGSDSIEKLEVELNVHLADYKTYMRRHKLEQGTSSLRVLVESLAGGLDGVVRLRFSRAVSGLFAVRDRKARLLSAELESPGRELAYIAQAEVVFGSPSE